MLMVARKFRRLNASKLLARVYTGTQYKDEVPVTRDTAPVLLGTD
ncbi:MAG: hypothetical protein QN198_10165 [Armatimonadota bacterium]|nr:hypothetical protein [Armatimonadota bacterium]MDR7435996.1 hypothetical protein [Armatimonadota bacterium]